MLRKFIMERFKCPVGVFLLLFENNKLVLQYRKNNSFSNMYGIFGGHLDGCEKIIDAIIREAHEEAGINIDEKNIKLLTICHSNADNKEYLQFYFSCDKWNGEIKNMEPNICEHIKSFELNQLPENIVPYLKEALEKIKLGISFYEDDFNI